jgi:hypothetical protein
MQLHKEVTVVKAVRWYERERLPYAVDRRVVKQYADWLNVVPWKLFCTFTFAWKVSDPQADKVFAEFINRVEKALRCDVGYVRGDEKRFSGCGKPACGRHFHALLTCAAPVSHLYIEAVWMSMAGNRSDCAGAKVEPYDPTKNGAAYVLKFVNQADGDWTFRKLHLFHSSVSLRKIDKRLRRSLRRHRAREKQFRSIAVVSPVWIPL